MTEDLRVEFVWESRKAASIDSDTTGQQLPRMVRDLSETHMGGVIIVSQKDSIVTPGFIADEHGGLRTPRCFRRGEFDVSLKSQ